MTVLGGWGQLGASDTVYKLSILGSQILLHDVVDPSFLKNTHTILHSISGESLDHNLKRLTM